MLNNNSPWQVLEKIFGLYFGALGLFLVSADSGRLNPFALGLLMLGLTIFMFSEE